MMSQQSQQNQIKNKKQVKINLFQIQKKKPQYLFLHPNHGQITQAIIKVIPLEKLLKLIHINFKDQGLTTTLIHRIYQSNQNQIAYYVPELVYIAVKKMCRSMRKVLIFKTASSINLRRLILWNIKAFTVLMILKEEKLKKFILQFEEGIIKNVIDEGKFKDSQKAISMLTQASLVLKKLPKEELKDQLKKFIKKYNNEILNNVEHSIVIPFRQDEDQDFHSTFVVRIIEQNCSCFPTRKRVPYRIILQTVDLEELKKHNQLKSPHLFKKNKLISPDKERDLYNETKQQVQKNYKINSELKIKDNKYPFVVDQQYFTKMTQLNKYAKKIQSEEKEKEKEKQKDKQKSPKKLAPVRRNTIETYRSLMRSSKFQEGNNNILYNQGRFQIKDNQQLRKYNAIYIPTLASNLRKSDISGIPKGIWVAINHAQNHKRRFSQGNSGQRQENKLVKEVQQQVKYDGNNNQSVFKQAWSQTVKSLKQTSPFNKLKSLKYRNMVIKGGDDLRQQIICMQLIYKMKAILQDARVEAFIKPYQIIVLSENSGMLQFVSNSISIDAIKKQKQISGLFQFYNDAFYPESRFLNAKLNFIRSLAGSSIITYILKIKDRHNGNILIDIDGNIIHIDFGFILGMSPGGINFESSPFKLTEQYVILMGGKESPDYMEFVNLFCDGMNAIRKRCSQLCLILEIMMEDSDLECFQGFRIQSFRQKFYEGMTDQKFRQHCQALVERSCFNSRTVHYDTFQKISNGIMP